MTHVDQIHPRIQAVNLETGQLTPFLFKYLVQLWERSGGPNDFIADMEDTDEIGLTNTQTDEVNKRITELRNERNLDSPSSEIAELDKRITALRNEIDLSPLWQTKTFFDVKLITTSANFTTFGDAIIVATSNVTITLNANPKDQEKVVVKRDTTAGSVTISAAAIDGTTSYVLLMNYEAAQCVYSETNSTWYIV